MLKTWRGHDKSLSCMLLSDDGSLLVSGSDDGMICVWNLISLLDVENVESFPSPLHYSTEHKSSITGLLTTSGISSPVLISSSLDGSCKVWDLVLGNLMHTLVYPPGITAVALHPKKQLIFSGSIDRRIFLNKLEIGLVEDYLVGAEDRSPVLKGHNILLMYPHLRTAPSAFGISAVVKSSEDSTIRKACINVIVRKSTRQLHDPIICIHIVVKFGQKDSIAAMEMKMETCLEGRMRATKMVKHMNVMEMNRHLQSPLLGPAKLIHLQRERARPIHLRRERARPSCLKILHCKRGRSSHKSSTHLCSHVSTYFAN